MGYYLPPTNTWGITANGFPGELDVQVDSSNRVSGSAFGDPITGLWQPTTGTFSFTRGGSTTQIYKGFLVAPLDNDPLNAVYTLAGTFDDISGTFGWFAQTKLIP